MPRQSRSPRALMNPALNRAMNHGLNGAINLALIRNVHGATLAILAFAITLAIFMAAERSDAKGGILIQPAAFYASSSSVESGDESESSVMRLNVTAGQLFPSGLLLGLKLWNVSETSSFDGTGSEKAETLGYGVLAGWSQPKGFHGAVSWLFDPEHTVTGSPSTTYNGGSALVLDLAWRIALSSSVEVGPQVSWSQFTWKKVTGGSTTTDLEGRWSDTSLTPWFAAWLVF
jgi:hypothetical protein